MAGNFIFVIFSLSEYNGKGSPTATVAVTECAHVIEFASMWCTVMVIHPLGKGFRKLGDSLSIGTSQGDRNTGNGQNVSKVVAETDPKRRTLGEDAGEVV